jgi:protein involved in polysaccharide export with SLBB domain
MIFSSVTVASTRVVSAIVIFILCWAGAATAQTSNYPIGAGDVLHVAIYAGGEQQEDFTAAVSPSGTITTPLLGDVPVNGLLASQVSDLLSRRFAAGYYVNPRVLVSVTEYAGKVYVFGEVHRPGAYAVKDGLTALNACILAGGFSDYAALNRVKVIRQGQTRTDVFTIDLGKVRKGKKPDMVLRPGDKIEVPHRKF